MAHDDFAAADDPFPAGSELVRLAMTTQRDPIADLLRANIRRSLVGIDEPPRIGRFIALGTVGRGAMGTVLAAYDPVLDRKVALKVLRPAAATSKAELLSEARLMARLTHPNVVAVFEADDIDDHIVIAMQFIQGPDLRGWLREQARDCAQIVQVFAAIARGLAAAHGAGIVHGDLKPENVLVGATTNGTLADGVRIADFGMARVVADPRVMREGGTPAYLAPERLEGAPASQQADQFAFAVSLYEAIFGQRPFEGTTVAQRLESMAQGSVPRDRGVPRRVVEVIQRGLAVDPRLRWPSMEAIVRELERDDRRGTRVLGVVAAVSVCGAAWFATTGTRDPCQGSADAAELLWNADAEARVRDAFSATAHARGVAIAQRVDQMLTARRDAWVAARREVCESNRVDAVQSDTLHDLRMRCLDRRAAEGVALVDALVAPGQPEAANDAITAIADLPELARCDANRVQDVDYAGIAGADAQSELTEAQAQLDRAAAAYALGRYAEANLLVSDPVNQAERLQFAPLQAEALALQGVVQARISPAGVAVATLGRARRIAAEIGNDRLVAEIMVNWLRTAMFTEGIVRVEELAEHARVAALRAGANLAEIEGIVGEARMDAGDATAALQALQQAFAVEARADRRAVLQVNLGSATLALGDAPAALALYEQALATATAHFGPEHPILGFYAYRVGRGLRAVGRLDESLRVLERALVSREATLGPDDRAIASVLADLAVTERELGRLDDAATHLRRAIVIREAAYGVDHVRLADLFADLGDVERDRDQLDDALAHYRRAAKIREATPEHPQVATLRGEIASLERARANP